VNGVFINYRGEDTRSYAALLYRELARHFGDRRVFLDSESIEAGADFADTILGRVRSARVVLAVVGPRWLAATDSSGRRRIDDPEDWIRRELAVAFAVGVRVIPILTDDATLPTADELPADIAALAGRQFRRLRHRDASMDLGRITADIGALMHNGSPYRAKQDELTTVADKLADSVAHRWQREEERRKIQDPLPLPLRWGTADEVVMDHWANICRTQTGEPADPLDLTGHLDQITEIYRRIPSGRLVVLGRAGSGKTVLSLRFVLDMLATRASGEPVPEIFSVGSWNPTIQPLKEWLSGQLCRDHPGLAAVDATGEQLAAALVGRGLILPVLDGFDELADGLHPAALRELSATTLPLVLTSRAEEYVKAVKGTRGLTRAAAIALNDLTLDSVADYLLRSSPKAAAPAWERVLAKLLRDPDIPAHSTVLTVLTTPLMVALARAVYSEGDMTRRDDPTCHPDALLDTTRFDSPQRLREHLLGSFIPSVYHTTRPSTWNPQRAQRWLGYLAAHLDRLGTPDLAWWELGTSVPRWARTLVLGALSGYVFGVATAVGNLPVDLIGTSRGLDFAIRRGLVIGTLHGVIAALVFGLIYWIADRNDLIKPSPVRMRLFNGARQRPGARFGTRITYGVLVGSAVALTLLVIDWLLVPRLGLDDGLGGGLWSAIEFPLEVGLAAGLGFGLTVWLEAPMDISVAASPADLLRSNRANVVFLVLIWAMVLGSIVGIVTSFTSGVLRSVEVGAVFGVEGAFMAGIGYGLCVTAWGQWLALARIWLPLTGRLPWRLLAFLDDACQRGALRRTGAVYQFRHARLRERLAARKEPSSQRR
jgi:hypothetical protein